jgi:CheY-like chemotaxis protein
MLQRLGCIVDTAQNGQVAVEMIVTDDNDPISPTTSMPILNTLPKYNVVFLDNQMVSVFDVVGMGEIMMFVE